MIKLKWTPLLHYGSLETHLITLMVSALAADTTTAAPATPEQFVRQFMGQAHSDRDPDAAAHYSAPVVQLHQTTLEGETTVQRTYANYAGHVLGFKKPTSTTPSRWGS